MMGEATGRKSTKEREAYFLEFATKIRSHVRTPLLLTGGMRSRETMERVLAEGHVDMVGLARPLTVPGGKEELAVAGCRRADKRGTPNCAR